MSTSYHLHRARIETLVDGIFAIAMTILVLELKVPDLTDRRSVDELMTALGQHAPVIAAYFFSFGILAAFWLWHHRLAEKIRATDRYLLTCIVGFLSLVCFFPFAAALLGRYPTNVGALMIYLSVTGLIVFIQTMYFKLAVVRGLLLESVSQQTVLETHTSNLRSCAIFSLGSVPGSMRLNEWVALGAATLGILLLLQARRITAQGKQLGLVESS